MGYFAAVSGAAANGPQLVRQHVVVTSEQIDEQRIPLAPVPPTPEDVSVSIRGISQQWPDRDFRVVVADATAFVAWDQTGDAMADVIAAGDDVLIEFLV